MQSNLSPAALTPNGGHPHNGRTSGRPVITPTILHRLAGGHAASEPVNDDLPEQIADSAIALGAFVAVLGPIAWFVL